MPEYLRRSTPGQKIVAIEIINLVRDDLDL